MLGIVAGTGFDNWDLIENQQEKMVKTPYGEATVYLGTCKGKEVVFLVRHAKNHSIPPHLINYRANVYALKMVGVTRIVALNAVGSLDETIAPGEVVLVDDFLDFTWGREHTYYTGGEAGVGHIDVANCYCQALQRDLLAAAKKADIQLVVGGIYVATQGPRFESKAEIRAFAKLGGTVVGMTGLPEVALSCELGICYGSLAVVTNYACGIGAGLDAQEIGQIMQGNKLKLEAILAAFMEVHRDQKTCDCSRQGVFF